MSLPGGILPVHYRGGNDWGQKPQALTAPANVAASTASANSISISWDQGDALSYAVERSESGSGNWEIVANNISASETEYVDQGLFASRTYYYRVAVRGYGGKSAYSTVVSATTSAITNPNVIQIYNQAELDDAINSISSGKTLRLNSNQYNLTQALSLNGAANVTVEGNGSNREAVELIGGGMDTVSPVVNGVWCNASGLVLSNLTIRDTYGSPVQLNYGAHDVLITNVKMLNAGEQFIKSNRSGNLGNQNGIVEDCWFEYLNGPPTVNKGGGTGYTNGIDVHGGVDWTIRRSTFKDFHTPDSADNWWNPAILMWNTSTGTEVYLCVFINCDRDVAFGLNDKSGGDHIGGVIRNNMSFMQAGLLSAPRIADSDAKILVWDSAGTEVYHNTIITNGNVANAIEGRWDTAGSVASNNVLDAPINNRNGSALGGVNNVTNADQSWFVAPASGNLRLNATGEAALTKVARLPSVLTDVDGASRPDPATPGADEYVAEGDPSNLPLLTPQALEAVVNGANPPGYMGSFAISGVDGAGNMGAQYVMGRCAYNPAGDGGNGSLFIDGKSNFPGIAEITIPALDSSHNYNSLNECTTLQAYTRFYQRNPNDGVIANAPVTGDPSWGDTYARTGAMQVIDGQLFVHAYSYYDNSGSDGDTTFVVRDCTDLAGSQVDGWYRMNGGARNQLYMFEVPEEWRSSLGGPYGNGMGAGMSIAGRYSEGPSLLTFDPADFDSAQSGPISTNMLMNYPMVDGFKRPLSSVHTYAGGPPENDNNWFAYNEKSADLSSDSYPQFWQTAGDNEMWVQGSSAKIGFIIPGTRTFCCIGTHGMLRGSGSYNLRPPGSTDGMTNDVGQTKNGPSRYYHDDGYSYYWLFDINEILAASETYDPEPYAYGKFNTDENGDCYWVEVDNQFNQLGDINGGSFDVATGKLFVIRDKVVGSNYKPIVDVFDLSSLFGS